MFRIRERRRPCVPGFLRRVAGIVSAAAPVLLFLTAAGRPAAQETWKVGVAFFDTSENDLVPAAGLLSRLVLDELKGADEHILTGSEQHEKNQKALEELQNKSYKTLAGLYSQRDQWLFDLDATSSSLRDLEDKIEQERQKLAELAPENPAPDVMPVEFPPPPGEGSLWDTGNISPEIFRKNAELDTLIAGTVTRVGSYFGIRITSHGPGGDEVLWEGAGEEGELELISSQAGGRARTIVLGRPWSSLTVQTNPPNASISVNGIAGAVGFWTDSTLVPGEFQVEIYAEGYRGQVITESLGEGEDKTLDITLEESDLPQVLVQTTPSGASVRVGSLWLGRAPLLVDLPTEVMALTVEKDGFRSRTVPLYPNAETLTVAIEPVTEDPAEVFAEARKKLYSSIAVFSFSLAPTVMLTGISQNYYGRAQTASDFDEQQQAMQTYNLTRGLRWGSFGINTALFGFVMFRLAKYLKAAESLSE